MTRLLRSVWLPVFLASAAVEGLSWFAFGDAERSKAALVLVAVAAFAAALKDARIVFGMLLVEMVIGGHGHLFSVEVAGFGLSVRMVLFAVLLAAWVVHVLRGCSRILHFSHAHVTGPLVVMVAVVAWGVLRGFANGIPAGDIVSDANGYAFLALVPIAIDLVSDRACYARTLRVFAGALAWLSSKTVLMLYAFGHDLPFLSELYRWQRKAWLAEITDYGGGFWRVFASSHVFLLLGLLAGFFLYWRRGGRGLLAWLGLGAAAFLLSFSRSFWLGAAVALAFTFPVLARLKLLTRRSAAAYLGRGAAVLAVGAVIVASAFFFPVPERSSDPSRFKVFGSRVALEDAAATSRWKMLGPLGDAIKTSPFMGSGFGAAITYRSDDPRIHDLFPGGVITTASIEWQYLALWMKVGVAGILAVVWLWWRIGRFAWGAIQRARGDDAVVATGLLAAFLAFIVANIFTPYLDHPLGWMFLALVLAGLHAVSEHVHENPALHEEPRTEPAASG